MDHRDRLRGRPLDPDDGPVADPVLADPGGDLSRLLGEPDRGPAGIAQPR